MKLLKRILFALFIASTGLMQVTAQTDATVFLSTENQIWAFDVDELTYNSVISMHDLDSIIGRFVVAQDESRIYYVEHTDTNSKLRIYRLDTNTSELIFEHPNLTLITHPSNNRMFLSLIDREQPEKSSVCLLSIESGSCDTIHIDINFSSFYWIAEDTFATFLCDDIHVYRILSSSNGNLEMVDELHLSNLGHFVTARNNSSIVFVASDETQHYMQSLYSVDTSTHDITSLSNIDLVELDAAVSRLAVSPNGNFLAYNITQNLFVVDLLSGDTIFRHEDTSNFTWASNDRLVLVRWGEEEQAYDLSVANITNNVVGERMPIPMETISVRFSE